jgi:hypothetical protein
VSVSHLGFSVILPQLVHAASLCQLCAEGNQAKLTQEHCLND